MNGVGNIIIHERYGKAKVTHVWHKTIDYTKKITKLYALTLEVLTTEGKILFNRDRDTTFKYIVINPLPRCYENDLSKIKLFTPES